MMPTINPFTLNPGQTVHIIPSAASANVLVSNGGGANSQVRVLNTASVTVFLAFGASTVTASPATDVPLFPAVGGSDYQMFTIPVQGGTYMAAAWAATASAAGNTLAVYATPGEGW